MIVGFSVVVVSALCTTICFIHVSQTHCTNCTSGIMERPFKAILDFDFNTHHCRKAFLILPCNGEYLFLFYLYIYPPDSQESDGALIP